MSNMFDVDCPRTPDGDDDRGTNQKTNDKNYTVSTNSRPPLPSARSRSASFVSASLECSIPRNRVCKDTSTNRIARPGGGSSNTTASRIPSRNAQFTPRPRGGGRRTSAKGLEPEEYIATPSMPLPLPPRHTPVTAVPVSTQRGRNLVTAATHYAPPNASSTNPFDVEGAEDEKYFGLGTQEKQELYGLSRKVSPDANTTSAADQGASNDTTPVPNACVVVQQQQQQQQQQQHQGFVSSNDHHSASRGKNNNHATAAPNINATATTTVVDDYSFSNVFTNINLSSPGNQSPGGVSTSGHPSPANVVKRTSHIRNNFVEWCGRSFYNKTERYQPPNLDYETNLAPRGVNYSCASDTNYTSEWVVSNCFSPNGIYVKDGIYSHRRREVMKMGLGVMVMVVMCTIFGVTISELKKASAALPNGGVNVGGGSQLNGMVPVPSTDFSSTRLDPIATTSPPSGSPTKTPATLSPTKSPLTRSPISGYYAVHMKKSDDTAWPTMSPITFRPTNKPSILNNPATKENTNMPRTGGKRGRKGGNDDCTDDADRFFLNHLSNHKNCAWLENGKSGFTDRKDKNCGGRLVEDELTGGEIIYVTTELGLACRRTCALYNGCTEDRNTDNNVEKRLGDADVGDEVDLASDHEKEIENGSNADTGVDSRNEKKIAKNEMNQSSSTSSSSSCKDPAGKFLNHNSHLKDCVWLHNNKEGKTDRKDMNCGSTDFPVVTELGSACRLTCRVYNNADGCEERTDDDVVQEKKAGQDDVVEKDEDKVAEEEDHSHAKTITKEEGKVIMRSYSSPLISYSLTSSNRSCTDGTDLYQDHKLTAKPCKWLDGSKHRQAMNCGSETHGISELGVECPWSCREYNDC